MKNIFISGSISIKSIDDNIKQRLDNIITSQHTILIGDAKGADLAIQSYLNSQGYNNVSIYCSGPVCRNNVGNWEIVNVQIAQKTRNRQFYMVKDEQMALDSDYGFMLWDGKSAGTINNLFNLVTNDKIGLIYLQSKQLFRTIRNVSEFVDFISECEPQHIDAIDKKISFRKKLESYQLPVQEQLTFTAINEPQEKSYDRNTNKK
ncbi:MAG: hypothetical protein U9Q91_05260 [Candidatus Marinimicrobia bacterium]|nr:hypothetical protein [Candidatus Neomarinimicrobiota bacterium]